jgi:hypothetical protein
MHTFNDHELHLHNQRVRELQRAADFEMAAGMLDSAERNFVVVAALRALAADAKAAAALYDTLLNIARTL